MKIGRFLEKTTFAFCFGGMVFAIPLMFLTTADAIGRSLFSKPLPGTIEISEYLLSIIILLGAAYTQQVKGHVGSDFLIRKLSQRKKRIAGIITTVLSILIISILSYQGLIQGLEEKTVSEVLRIPQKPFRLLVFVGGVLLLLELLRDLVELIRRRRT